MNLSPGWQKPCLSLQEIHFPSLQRQGLGGVHEQWGTGSQGSRPWACTNLHHEVGTHRPVSLDSEVVWLMTFANDISQSLKGTKLNKNTAGLRGTSHGPGSNFIPHRFILHWTERLGPRNDGDSSQVTQPLKGRSYYGSCHIYLNS